ncbi:hypothetical protein V492_06398 [Pseudogymnoascus sp. VKM F-4246]|nr:hypothetical protein V492_06398 [Pseudogymnoascus sp. VKM F-4246]
MRGAHLIGWWDFHPLPATTPAPFNDPEKYGCISCWGIGVVIESTSPLVPKGTKIWGYLPIGTEPVSKTIIASESQNYFVDTTEHRKHLPDLYNRYFICRGSSGTSESDFAWDATMKIMFETAYLINRVVLSWDLKGYPTLSPNGSRPWSPDDADLKNTVILVFAPSTATFNWSGLSCLEILGGWYDEVLVYSDDPIAAVREASIGSNSRVLIIDFGSRELASASWANKLYGRVESIQCLVIGTDPTNSQGIPETLTAFPDQSASFFSALVVRNGAAESVGASTYFGELDSALSQ